MVVFKRHFQYSFTHLLFIKTAITYGCLGQILEVPLSTAGSAGGLRADRVQAFLDTLDCFSFARNPASAQDTTACSSRKHHRHRGNRLPADKAREVGSEGDVHAGGEGGNEGGSVNVAVRWGGESGDPAASHDATAAAHTHSRKPSHKQQLKARFAPSGGIRIVDGVQRRAGERLLGQGLGGESRSGGSEGEEGDGSSETAVTEGLLSLVDADFLDICAGRAALAAIFPRSSAAGVNGDRDCGTSAAPPSSAPARAGTRQPGRGSSRVWAGELLRAPEPPHTATTTVTLSGRRGPDGGASGRGTGGGEGLVGQAISGSSNSIGLARVLSAPRINGNDSLSHSLLLSAYEAPAGGRYSGGQLPSNSTATVTGVPGLGRLPNISAYIAVPLLPPVLPSARLSASGAGSNTARF